MADLAPNLLGQGHRPVRWGHRRDLSQQRASPARGLGRARRGPPARV